MKQGVAAAMAMGDAPMPSHEGGVSYLLTGATFRGEFAGSASLMYRLNTRSPMAVQVGAAFAGNKNTGARIGIGRRILRKGGRRHSPPNFYQL